MSSRKQKRSLPPDDGKKEPNDEEQESDEEKAQRTSLMSQAAMSTAKPGRREATPPAQSTGENSYLDRCGGTTTNMDLGEAPKPVSPTGKLAWIGFGLAVFSLACMCISFASPYWLQQWELSFNTFNNMGLWEACFHNYMHHRDDLQEIYNGCFWVYNSDPRYNKLRDWLVPPWFISCQVMSTIVLLVLLAVVIMTALVFLHMCPMSNHEYHQIFAMFISGAMMFLCTMTTLITAILFGVQVQDRNWMPRPDWNMLSWGYGFLVLCGMFSLAAGFCLFSAAWKAYNELLRDQDEYFKAAMEMASQYAPSVSQVSYGYGDKPSYSSQPYSQSHPSYEKESFEKPSYGQSQSSYGTEKPPFEQHPSYENQYDHHDSAEQPPTYNGARAQYGQQPSYDGSHGYDSAQGGYRYDQYGRPVI